MPQEKTSPEQVVLLNDIEVPLDLRSDILESVVTQHVEGGDAFQIRINALDSRNQRLKWIDSADLNPGAKVELRFGYRDHQSPVFQGEVVALRTEFPSNSAPVLLLEGFDRLHRLRRGRRTRLFTKLKDSDMARQIAGEHHLAADVTDTKVTHEYVLQDNLSDYEFLLDRARRIRHEVLARGTTLVFREAANHRGQVVDLEYRADLKNLVLRLSTAPLVSQVSVRGWNPETKQALVGVARAGDETSRMGGRTLGSVQAERAFSATSAAIVDVPVFTQDEADQAAKARFNESILRFITGEAEVVGNPALAAGTTVRLQGIGERFTGTYYVTKAEHRLGPAIGYVTRLQLRRSAS